MRRLSIILPMLVTGCVSSVNDAALCDATAQARKAHAQALVVDGGDHSVVTGANLLDAFKAGCDE